MAKPSPRPTSPMRKISGSISYLSRGEEHRPWLALPAHLRDVKMWLFSPLFSGTASELEMQCFSGFMMVLIVIVLIVRRYIHGKRN